MPPLLDIRNLTISFGTARESMVAVRDLSLHLDAGEVLAIVGESGSGKSVTALALTRLLPTPPAHIDHGEILYAGRNLLLLPENDLRKVRGGEIGYVFQDPATSLNPVFTIRNQIAEALAFHRPEIQRNRKAYDEEIIRVLTEVGITEPEKRLEAYPHQLSGGMQQRVMIAAALACQPKILIADEPTTALDITIQRQIMNLLREIKAKRGMSILLITHNFGIIGGLADRVAVMYRGELVEAGAANRVLHSPAHPYTRALIDCIPKLGANRRRLATIGDAVKKL